MLNKNEKINLDDLLVDTWWYALTKRISESDFKRLAYLRVKQGFSAVQLVVGIPPEIGPENENAKSIVGAAWDLDGNLNDKYLELAFSRISFLNRIGLTVIIYGAWGHQIEWLGKEKMIKWWELIINKMDKLNVVYCLTGEVDLLIGKENILLPDKTTYDLNTSKILKKFPKIISRILIAIVNIVGLRKIKTKSKLFKKQYKTRKEEWSNVLDFLAKKTKKPIIVHTTVKTGYDSVNNPELLSANTVQTGHSQNSRKELWKQPIKIFKTSKRYINLEPWYEGIRNDFREEDQLFSYWVTMLSGATSYCYGAHGIWNIGDNEFLSQWGKQTFEEAINLDTPRLIGLSHRQFMLKKHKLIETICNTMDDKLISIERNGKDGKIYFFPEISCIKNIPKGDIWLPLKGEFVKVLPKEGQVVIFTVT